MADFFPPPGSVININKVSYEVSSHPEAKGLAYGLEQGEAIVYQLRKITSKGYYALKIFKPYLRGDFLIKKTNELKKFSKLEGLSVCDRVCLSGKDNPLIKKYPELEYSILMPWIAGDTWSNIIQKKVHFNKSHSLTLAMNFSKIMQNLEKNSLAHCDISDGNVILDTMGGKYIELIDVEHLYYPHSERPTHLPAGSNGYAHKEASKGLWSEVSDRFAVAILLAEIICWHDQDFRKTASDDNVFPQNHIHKTCDQYLLAKEILKNISRELCDLLEKAWTSNYLHECPTASEWFTAITNTTNPSPVRKWKPLPVFKPAPKYTRKFTVTEEAINNAPQNAPEVYYTKDQDGYLNGTIRWIARSAETTFELLISKDKDFKTIFKKIKLTEKEFTFEEGTGIYYCRVRSITTDSGRAWSNVLKISINEK